MFDKFNKWYDQVKEPNRFLYLMGYIAVMVCLLNCTAVLPVAVGGLMIAAILSIAFSRM